MRLLFWLAVAFVASTFWVYTSFFALATAKRLIKEGIELPRDMRLTCRVLLVIGWPADVVYNATRGWLMFGERPRELTFSSRIERYMRDQAAAPDLPLATWWATFLNVAMEDHIRWDVNKDPP